MGYTKLFSEIVTSSIWNEDDKTRIVWITLLALSNADGYVSCVPTSLALMSRVPIEDCIRALERLANPDSESRTPDNYGRRIEKVEGGWIILNYAKYRERVSDDPYAVAARERQRRYRSKQCDITLRNATKCDPASASASASACIKSSPEGDARGSRRGEDGNFDLFWQAYPRKQDKKKAFEAWNKAKTKPSLDILLAKIEEHKKSEQWQDGIIPHPTTWLNRERWNDEMPEKYRSTIT